MSFDAISATSNTLHVACQLRHWPLLRATGALARKLGLSLRAQYVPGAEQSKCAGD